jgi:hypothetical protein
MQQISIYLNIQQCRILFFSKIRALHPIGASTAGSIHAVMSRWGRSTT